MFRQPDIDHLIRRIDEIEHNAQLCSSCSFVDKEWCPSRVKERLDASEEQSARNRSHLKFLAVAIAVIMTSLFWGYKAVAVHRDVLTELRHEIRAVDHKTMELREESKRSRGIMERQFRAMEVEAARTRRLIVEAETEALLCR